MSDIKELEANATQDERTSGPTASADTTDTANADVDAPNAAPVQGPPTPGDHPRPSPGDRASRPTAISKKYNKTKGIRRPRKPLEPTIEFEKPAPLKNGRLYKSAKPRPARGNPAKEPDPFAIFHAADKQDTAGQSERADEVPDASHETTDLGTAPPAPVDPEAAWKIIREAYRYKPVEFAIDVLGVTPDEWQAEAMNYTARGGRLLSVRAGHGVGKSAFCAWLVLWHMVVFFPQKTILTAPTQGQLFDALFAEVKFWLRRMPEPIRDIFEAQAERIVHKAAPEASFVSARTSSKERPEALAGVHSEEGSVLLIADEASAIPEEVYEAATGSMSGKTAHTILISNPTRVTGLFHDTHHRLKRNPAAPAEENMGRWHTMHVSCLNTKRADPAFAAQIIETYGIESNQYRVRVLGEFATREDDVLIPAEWVDAAVKRDIALDIGAPLVYGLDVARFGDDRCVLVKRRGNVVIDIKWWAKEDAVATVGRVKREADIDKPDQICVDSIGMGGPVADFLRRLKLNVRDVNVSETAAMNPTASRLRDDLWLQVKDWLGTRAVKIPDDERLRQDLVAPTYSFSMSGKIVVEPKHMMKKRRLPSPDYADALCLTFASDAAMVGGRGGSLWIRGEPLRRNIAGVV